MRTPRKSGKRPCRICGKWYIPHPRCRDHQKTCGKAECKRQWHRKECAKWNRKNRDYYRSNYLGKKLQAAEEAQKVTATIAVRTLKHCGVPTREVQDVIGAKAIVIIDYIIRLLILRFQEVMRV